MVVGIYVESLTADTLPSKLETVISTWRDKKIFLSLCNWLLLSECALSPAKCLMLEKTGSSDKCHYVQNKQ